MTEDALYRRSTTRTVFMISSKAPRVAEEIAQSEPWTLLTSHQPVGRGGRSHPATLEQKNVPQEIIILHILLLARCRSNWTCLSRVESGLDCCPHSALLPQDDLDDPEPSQRHGGACCFLCYMLTVACGRGSELPRPLNHTSGNV